MLHAGHADSDVEHLFWCNVAHYTQGMGSGEWSQSNWLRSGTKCKKTKRSSAIIVVSSSAEMSSSIFTVWWQVICTSAELALRESNCYML
jgi:hypothetical protein